MSVVRQIQKNPGQHLVHAIFQTLYGIVKYFPTPLGFVLRYVVCKPFFRQLDSIWIFDGVHIWYPNRIRIGRGVTLNEGVFITGLGGLEIGDGSLVGHGTTILTSHHNFRDGARPIRSQGSVGKRVVIEPDVWLGCHVTVLNGITIGRGAVVGAGAVVTKDVPPYAIAVGVPARVIGWREDAPAV